MYVVAVSILTKRLLVLLYTFPHYWQFELFLDNLTFCNADLVSAWNSEKGRAEQQMAIQCFFEHHANNNFERKKPPILNKKKQKSLSVPIEVIEMLSCEYEDIVCLEIDDSSLFF